MDYLYLFSGFILLLVSGDFLLRGSVSLAGHFNVSKLVIGVVIVSLGTSAPELVVSIKAALSGHPDMAIGNI
ncbi:MAG: sodium:calcium antiporter, partial [Bacteroidales bacterium]|nr:sodium:calcium antiporter [Bacteroidales bacterium]